MANLATFRNAVASKLGLDNTASSAEQVLIDSWLNEGVLNILSRTQVRVAVGTMDTIADTGDYEFDTDIMRVVDLYLESDSQNYSLSRVTPAELIDMRRRGVAAAPPTRYYAVAGSNLLMVYPTPAGADTITVFYVPRPAAMAATGNDPSATTYGGIPTEHHKAIEYYALWQGGDYADDPTSNFGLTYQLQYEQALREITKANSRMGGGRLAPARVNARRRRHMVPHHPSQDLG